MKTVFLIRRDNEYLWNVRQGHVIGMNHTGRILWGSKYSEHVKEFKTFDEASQALDKLPEHSFMGAPYFEIVKFLKK